jgi:two-component system, chemotaxis family, chemotaxis protein CheY
MPSVLIVDDEDDIRFILRWMVEEISDEWYVVGEATSAEDAVAGWRELRPDFVIMDHLLRASSGLDAARRILAEQPHQRIVLLSMIGDEGISREATALGVTMCVSKAKLQDIASVLIDLARETPS